MSELNPQQLTSLKKLIRINSASERGFNLTGEHVKNRALKLIFKSLAQERAEFAAQLRSLVEEAKSVEGSGWLAAIHRGWINIKAGMTIGEPATESVVLAEVSRGERAARRAYRNVLDGDLPGDIRNVVERQFSRLEETKERVQQLRGEDSSRMVVQLFDTGDSARAAAAALAEAGFDSDDIEQVPVEEAVARYQGQETGRTTVESTVAGALIGAGAGIVIGLVAMISASLAPEPLLGMPLGELGSLTLVAALAAGLLIGGLFGAIIGVGVVQDDAYRYSDGMERGSVLLMVRADRARADDASAIMKGSHGRRWQPAAGA